ncbi:LOW QUALITY PROTEIN: glutathione S-transferase C-terminal domain-containing protein-like [Liolophura sinensis]|uniref:LOW QUALITY PROTEIN: glutathione S-transferase C-terminal domain-containing protein-like n=1 Tax=Liolophura sinensis TaxID=3198878 RepID=UPI00315952CE
MLDIYLEGWQRPGIGQLCLTMYSCAVMFVVRYCKLRNYNLILVKTEGPSDNCDIIVSECCISERSSLTNTNAMGLPSDVASCRLPVVKGHTDNTIRSGLCSSVRYIALQAHQSSPTEHFDEILGFRGGTLKSCAEVSSWTRLCEVEIPGAVCGVQKTLKYSSEARSCESLVFPSEIERLEKHLRTPVLLHNDDKKKGEVLSALRKRFTKSSLSHLLQGKLECENMTDHVMKILQQDIWKEHCVTKFQILKKFEGIDTVIPGKKKHKKKRKGKRKERLELLKTAAGNNVVLGAVDDSERSEESGRGQNCELQAKNSCDGSPPCPDSDTTITKTIKALDTLVTNGLSIDSEEASIGIQHPAAQSCEKDVSLHVDTSGNQSDVLSHLVRFIHSLEAADVHLDHCYVEGIKLTLADLLLFVFIHFFLVSVQSSGFSVQKCCPAILQWYSHMTSLPRVRAVAEDCGMAVLHVSHQSNSILVKEMTVVLSDDTNTLDMETTLSHHSKGHCRPLKPDVANALQKVQSANISPRVGEHPCGEDIHLDWLAFPKEVYPFNDSLPKSKVQSKCEQLENLVSAVVKIAQPGHVIVDFCSGGGHLGIVIAYLLPDCANMVYLIENKEESCHESKEEVDDLRLNNVILFQCNMDYFNGQFDIGVCLHGCGVATDMVLQKCLDNQAAFVVCPCCYGKVQNTHNITYPRSDRFREAGLTAKEYIILGHAADQTEVGIELEEQGKHCSNLVDTDRGLLFQQHGYSVTLCSLQPVTCTTKNNLLIGVPPGKSR